MSGQRAVFNEYTWTGAVAEVLYKCNAVSLVFLREGGDGRSRKKRKKIHSPTLLVPYGASAQDALYSATTFARNVGYWSMVERLCAKLPCFSAKAQKEGGRKE